MKNEDSEVRQNAERYAQKSNFENPHLSSHKTHQKPQETISFPCSQKEKQAAHSSLTNPALPQTEGITFIEIQSKNKKGVVFTNSLNIFRRFSIIPFSYRK